ncbi:MAG TPA: serine hydrolase domain-containing protein, partial [Gemmatimonadaceae bacterium]
MTGCRIIPLAALGFATSIGAQSTGPTHSASRTDLQRSALAQYEGVYAYHDNTTLTMIAADTILFAVIDEARYPLRPLSGDRFVNAGGDTIPFRKTAAGVVSGFEERGIFFARHTSAVDSATAAAVRATPRPLGTNGHPLPYFYAIPPHLGDGLRVGNLTEAGFDSAIVARIVGRVADGSYPDVHGLLVYRGGKLVVEEYFYGFDRDKVHQMRSASKSVISALVGIAIDQGALKSESELVTRHLPYTSYTNADPRKDRLTIRDLLTMRSGLACDDWDGSSPGNESRVYPSADWVKFVLALPMIDTPGTKGHYCSGNVMVAG